MLTRCGTVLDFLGWSETPANLRVAFIGDQGLGPFGPIETLNLVADEGAEFLVIAGDFEYADSPFLWELQTNTSRLGADYPLFGVVGNHDDEAWDGYQEPLEGRLANATGATCDGELGFRANCHYKGLHIVQSGVGLLGADPTDHAQFVADSLQADDSIWSICLWHMNENDMQTGTKGDAVGWGVYQACQDNGGIVITGHEHAYNRTLTLTDVGNEANGHGATGQPDLMEVTEGSTFVVVSGVVGSGVRDFVSDQHDDDTWWASVWTNNVYIDNGAPPVSDHDPAAGALFIDFNVDGDPRKAYAYFKTIRGDVINEFTIERK